MSADPHDIVVPAMSIFDVATKALEQDPALFHRWACAAEEKNRISINLIAVITQEELVPVLAAWRLTHPVSTSSDPKFYAAPAHASVEVGNNAAVGLRTLSQRIIDKVRLFK